MDRDERQRENRNNATEPRTKCHGLGTNRRGAFPAGMSSDESRPSGISRRTFLKGTAITTAGLILGPRLLSGGNAFAGVRTTKVVRTYHAGATTGLHTIHQEPVDLMVHSAIHELTGICNTADAWKSLFPGITSSSKIGIKINLACGDVPTHPEIVNAIVDGLRMMDLGGLQLPEENIIVHDYDNAFFCAQTGYVQNWGGPGVQYVGSDLVGFDTAYPCVISHPHSSTSTHHPSKIITQHCDYLINVPVLKDHSDSDLTLCLKNHYGTYNQLSINEMHTHWYYGDGHTRGEPSLNMHLRDVLGDKTKLHLVDGTLCLNIGGPGYTPPGHTPPDWAYNSVIAGLDPVAVDRIGTEKINEERIIRSLSEIDPSHVTAAAGAPYNLGTDNLADIDLVEIDAATVTGVEEGYARPNSAILLAPYPNPTRGESTLRFQCGADSEAELMIVSVQGRLVRRVAAGRYPSGMHSIVWDGRDESGRSVSSGVYFARLHIAGKAQQRRIVLVR